MNKKVIFGIIIIGIIAIILCVIFVTNRGDSGTSSNIFNNSYSGNAEEKILYAGKDIATGNYEIKCTDTSYAMDIVIFANEEDYKKFDAAERYTIGEFSKAVNAYSWADFEVKKDNKAYIQIKENYIIYLDKGSYEFNKCNISSSNELSSGVYIVDEDIDSGKYDIKCTSDSMEVTIFENAEKYNAYRKANRYTIGEAAEAIQNHSISSKYIYNGKTTSVELKSNMIMMIEDGNGEYTTTN